MPTIKYRNMPPVTIFYQSKSVDPSICNAEDDAPSDTCFFELPITLVAIVYRLL